MFKGTTFNFEGPFCQCVEIRLGWGISMLDNKATVIFQCNNCQTKLLVEASNLKAGFEFDNLPVYERTPESPVEAEQPSNDIVEVDNVIYGPWAGVEVPNEEFSEEDEVELRYRVENRRLIDLRTEKQYLVTDVEDELDDVLEKYLISLAASLNYGRLNIDDIEILEEV